MRGFLGHCFWSHCEQFQCKVWTGFYHVFGPLFGFCSRGISSSILMFLACVSKRSLIRVGGKEISSSIFSVSSNYNSNILFFLTFPSNYRGICSFNVLCFFNCTNIGFRYLLFFSICNLLAFYTSTCWFFWSFIVGFREKALESWFINIVRKLCRCFYFVIFKITKILHLDNFVRIFDVDSINCVIVVA